MTIQKSALHLWCTLHLRYGKGKAAVARELMAAYHEILCKENGIKTVLDADEWVGIQKVMEMFPLSWFADDNGLTRLITAIKTTIDLYNADHKDEKIFKFPELSDARFAGLRN